MSDPHEIAEAILLSDPHRDTPDAALARAFLAQQEELEAAEFRLRGQREEIEEWKLEAERGKWPKEKAQEYHQMKAQLATQQPVIDAPEGWERVCVAMARLGAAWAEFDNAWAAYATGDSEDPLAAAPPEAKDGAA